MVARIQKIMVLATLLAMALLWHWMAPRSLAWAWAGVLLPLLLHASVLALQFVLMQRANAGANGPAPRASAAQLLRAWAGEVVASVRLFSWRQPFRSNAEQDLLTMPGSVRLGVPAPRGVVLVHGFLCNRGLWNPWMRALHAKGHVFQAVNLEPMMGSIEDYVSTVEDAVQRITSLTGQAPVLLCHSMGGLVARAWLRTAQDNTRVHRVITIAAPHQGTALADFAYSPNGRQMQMGGHWLELLQSSEPPGRAALFTCWYSNCDNIVFPAHAATLDGADNRLLSGVAHVAMATHSTLMRVCLDELARDVYKLKQGTSP